MRLYYAQNREDLLIRSFFPDVKNGFYIDVGANDPTLDSVTKLLYEEGWSGVNIEPIKRHVDALNRDRPRDTNLQIGISNKSGAQSFTEYLEGDGLSTFDSSMREYYKNAKHTFPTSKTKSYTISVRTLEDIIIQEHPKHIHFIKIDVEGYEYEVVSSYRWSKNRPELVCIETSHTFKTKDWGKILKQKDYELAYFDGVNEYYLAKESSYRKELFNYENAVFARNPVYYSAYKEVVEDEAEKNSSKLKLLETKIHDQEVDIALLHSQQRDIKFLAKRLNEELKIRLNRRANSVKQAKGLIYQDNPNLSKKIKSNDLNSEEALKYIHTEDRKNVKGTNYMFKVQLKQYFWKVISKLYMFLIKIIKKITL